MTRSSQDDLYPPLPEPVARSMTVTGLAPPAQSHYFTADQMHTYGEACAKAAREREREACADIAHWQTNGPSAAILIRARKP